MQTDENKFTALLRKYLDNQAEPAEIQELMGMIKSGLYDKRLKQVIDRALLEERSIHQEEVTPGESARKDISLEAAHHLLQKILSSEEQTAQLIPAAGATIRYGRWLSAAAVLLVLLTGWWFFLHRTEKELVKTAVSPAPMMPPPGKGKFMRLPDGSTVLLNNGSKLDYGEAFNNKTREVTLTGEGYFDIRRDGKRPFIVHAGKVNTTVLGTAFNIRAWAGQPEVIVTVTKGKVKVSDNTKTYGIITSNQQITVSTNTDGYYNQEVNAESALTWKKDYLILDDISFEEAAHMIGAKYHINLVLVNDKLKNCRITATFLSHENLEQVLNVVCGVWNATYSTEPDGQILIDAKDCNCSPINQQ